LLTKQEVIGLGKKKTIIKNIIDFQNKIHMTEEDLKKLLQFE
jgi:hypothetical protein